VIKGNKTFSFYLFDVGEIRYFKTKIKLKFHNKYPIDRLVTIIIIRLSKWLSFCVYGKSISPSTMTDTSHRYIYYLKIRRVQELGRYAYMKASGNHKIFHLSGRLKNVVWFSMMKYLPKTISTSTTRSAQNIISVSIPNGRKIQNENKSEFTFTDA
jgi:hypothetical protein